MGCSSSKTANSLRLEDSRIHSDFASNFFDHYLLDVKLDQGRFAQVRRLVCRTPDMTEVGERSTSTQEKCAKILDLRDRQQPGKALLGLHKLAVTEARILKRLGHHPNIIASHGAYIDENICFLVMERCDCSLYQYMKHMPDLNERSLGKLLFQMISALHHVHSVRVVHRDVRPDNFAVSAICGNKVKLCDCGLAAVLPAHGKLRELVGTTPFTCPEMLAGEEYDTKADIWSLAVTVHVFFFGVFPYDYHKKQIFGERLSECSVSAVNFVHALLHQNAKHRPSAAEALNLPYIATVSSHYMKETALPSLQPMLSSARKIGAISSPDLTLKTDLDDFLHTLQLKNGGTRMPDGLSGLSRKQLSASPNASISSESTSCGSKETGVISL